MTSTCAHRGSLWKSAVVMKSLWAAQMITAFSVVSEISGCNPLLFLVDGRFCMYRYTNLFAEYAKFCWQLTWLRGIKNPQRCVDGFQEAKRGALTPIDLYHSCYQIKFETPRFQLEPFIEDPEPLSKIELFLNCRAAILIASGCTRACTEQSTCKVH